MLEYINLFFGGCFDADAFILLTPPTVVEVNFCLSVLLLRKPSVVRRLLAKVGCVFLGPRWCECTTEPHVSQCLSALYLERFVWGVVKPCLKAKMFSAVTNGHTQRCGGKPVVIKRSETQSNAWRNGAHFQTVSPPGVAFGCTREKVSCVKNGKSSLGKFNPGLLNHLHGPGHLL